MDREGKAKNETSLSNALGLTHVHFYHLRNLTKTFRVWAQGLKHSVLNEDSASCTLCNLDQTLNLSEFRSLQPYYKENNIVNFTGLLQCLSNIIKGLAQFLARGKCLKMWHSITIYNSIS